jgi:hypothetical protein
MHCYTFFRFASYIFAMFRVVDMQYKQSIYRSIGLAFARINLAKSKIDLARNILPEKVFMLKGRFLFIDCTITYAARWMD